ncbi:hypothetical protein MRB53_006327 [Persea americana]|uniref:Uncharacterized protein n=1 Tax=Persea americana TaxID=3435 RepID=A0ACC2MGV2_PERAE|nr:hypothetical protein MRB53_006327 [Persea americana]
MTSWGLVLMGNGDEMQVGGEERKWQFPVVIAVDSASIKVAEQGRTILNLLIAVSALQPASTDCWEEVLGVRAVGREGTMRDGS